jgi:hypothetical protein
MTGKCPLCASEWVRTFNFWFFFAISLLFVCALVAVLRQPAEVLARDPGFAPFVTFLVGAALASLAPVFPRLREKGDLGRRLQQLVLEVALSRKDDFIPTLHPADFAMASKYLPHPTAVHVAQVAAGLERLSTLLTKRLTSDALLGPDFDVRLRDARVAVQAYDLRQLQQVADTMPTWRFFSIRRLDFEVAKRLTR